MGDPQSELRCPGIQNVRLLMLPLPSSLVCAQLGPVQKHQGLASLSGLPCCSKFKMKSSKKTKNPLLPTLCALPAPNHPFTQFHSPRQTCLFFQRFSLMFVNQCCFIQSWLWLWPPLKPKDSVTQNFYYYHSQTIKTKLDPLGFGVTCPRSHSWVTEGLNLGPAL